MTVCVLFIGLSGCNKPHDDKAHGHRAITALLDSAEAVMNDSPEYAYHLLERIDSSSIRSRSLNARYALIYSEVLFKNYTPAPNDSLIMVAVRYYSVGNHPLQLFRSFYSLGCIYNESGQLIDAAVALGQAEQLADKIDDSFRLGLLYSQLGDVFFNSYDFQRAEKYFRTAYDFYEQAGKDAHKMYALFDVGRCQMEQHLFSSAHNIMEEVREWAELNNQIRCFSNSLLDELSCSVYLEDLETATSEINTYISRFGEPQKDVKVFSKFARYYILADNPLNAARYISEGWQISVTKLDSALLWYCESLLDQIVSKHDSALINYKHTVELQNQNIYKILDQPLLGAQKDYYKSLSKLESLKASHSRNMAIFLFIILVLLVVIIKVFNYSKTIKTESEKQGLLLTIKELRLKEDSNNETINRLSSRVNDLFSRPYEELDEIFDKLMETEDLIDLQTNAQDSKKKEYYYRRVDDFYKHVKEKFNVIISDHNQKELDRIIDSSCNNLMTRLEDVRLNLTKQDLLILRLSIVGFSLNTISRLTNTRYKTVHQQRRRAIQKIAVISEDMASEVCNVLKMC